MRTSTITARITFGPVLEGTRMTYDDVMEVLRTLDLNQVEIEPMFHVLTDIKTGKPVMVEDLKTGLRVSETYAKGDA